MSSSSGVVGDCPGDIKGRACRAWRSLVLVTAFLASTLVGAQSFPDKPIKLIVPMPPAGTTDNMCRLAGQKLAEILGQPVIVENRAGANGNIGSDFVSKAPPDGYTLLVSGVGSQGINATLYRNMPYDVVEGLTHIAMISKGPNALAVTGLTRRAALADVPTVAESGFPGFEAESWTGISGPPNMPAEVVAKLNAAMLRAVRLPDVRERFASPGLDAAPGTPEQMKAFVRNEVTKWGKAVRSSGAKVD